MDASVYLDHTLKKMSATHDIHREYKLAGRVFPAYARYASTSEKYVLTRKANLWTAREYEHVLFVQAGQDPPEGAGQASPDKAAHAARKGSGTAVRGRTRQESSAGETVPAARIEDLELFIRDCMEPFFVRGRSVQVSGAEAPDPASENAGRKYPEKNHMRSFLTVVVLSEKPFSEEAVRRVRRFRFDRSYLFSFRGFAQGRIVAVDLSCGRICVSPAARQLGEFFRTALQVSGRSANEPV